MGHREKFNILNDANKVVADALRQQAATEDLSPTDRQTALLEALALSANDLSSDDTIPTRRAKEEYIALPTDNESLNVRGMKFVDKLGGKISSDHVLVANRDDLLEVTITDSQDPTLFAQTTMTITRKGEMLAASIGEFLKQFGARDFITNPSRIQELDKQGLDIFLFLDEALANSQEDSYGIRDTYDLDVTDENIGQSLSGTIHLMEAVSEICSTRSVGFVQPLVVVETNMRNRWPYQGATKGVLIITDAIPAEYEAVGNILLDSTPGEIKRLENKIEKVSRNISKRLAKKRGIDLPLELPLDEVYMNKRTGRLLVTGLTCALPDIDRWYGTHDDSDDADDNDGNGDIRVK